ncbi:MAG TPA: ATP-binding protein [Lentisphaeria bacterium]|nr:MAG: hypothetical protein A2X45_05720 [Lentisphaerae bacterium GWF2_50_93]HCE44758.1 ATP-binding protein [Lentisphaeria bacterium]
MNLKINFRNELAELQKVSGQVEGFLGRNGIPQDSIYSVQLVLEEMISNVMKYAFNDSCSHDIFLEISVENKKLGIIVEDDGIEFNPLSAPEKKTDAPIHEREIGGLGIHLVKNMVQDMSYCRRDGKNHLEMVIGIG